MSNSSQLHARLESCIFEDLEFGIIFRLEVIYFDRFTKSSKYRNSSSTQQLDRNSNRSRQKDT